MTQKTDKKDFASFNLPKDLIESLKTWKTAFEASYGTRVPYEEMIKRMIQGLEYSEPGVVSAYNDLINPPQPIKDKADSRMEFKYTKEEYYHPFNEGDYITLTRGDGLKPGSAPWIIGILATRWNPGIDNDLFVIADYTFRQKSSFSDSVRVYEKPDIIVPYFEGWRPATLEEKKILDDALARTGHTFNDVTRRITPINPINSMELGYQLISNGRYFNINPCEVEE